MTNSNVIPIQTQFNNILDVVKRFPNEETCREYFEQIRWNGTITCPHCGSQETSKFKSGKLYWCKDCKKQFTVKVGTIFEDSALPLQKWFMALHILTSHKKGISSLQLGKDIGVTQKTAWFMLHRIRHAVKAKSFNKPMSGVIECDETYIGGRHRGKRGRGSENKTPVFGMVTRGGEIRTMPIPDVKRSTLQGII